MPISCLLVPREQGTRSMTRRAHSLRGSFLGGVQEILEKSGFGCRALNDSAPRPNAVYPWKLIRPALLGDLLSHSSWSFGLFGASIFFESVGSNGRPGGRQSLKKNFWYTLRLQKCGNIYSLQGGLLGSRQLFLALPIIITPQRDEESLPLPQHARCSNCAAVGC